MTFPANQLRLAGVSSSRVTALAAAYAEWPEWRQDQLRAIVASSSDTVIRQTYGDGTVDTVDVSGPIAAAHDTDAEREAFVPARLADTALKAAYARPRRDGRTIVLGDSVDAAVAGWFPYLTVLSGQKVKHLRNAGVGGETTTTYAARVQAAVIAYSPDVCIFGGATNDHSQGVPEATTRANLRGILAALRAAGVQPVVRTTPPCDVAASAAPWNTVAARRAVIQRHNTWLQRWAEVEGVPVLDLYAPLVDPVTGGYKGGGTGGTYSADGTHPRELGSKEAAQAMIAAGLPPVFQGRVQLGVAATMDPTMLPTGNGTFTTDATADGAADTWNFTGFTARSLVTGDAAIVGNWQRVTLSGSAGATVYQQMPGSDPKRIAGHRVGWAFRGRSVGGGMRARILQTGGGAAGTLDLGPFTQPIDGVFYVEAVIVEAATDLRFYAMGEIGATQMDIAQARAVDLTALDALA